jgi:ATP-dependent DNA helicase DinG
MKTDFENVPHWITSLGEPGMMAYGCYVVEKTTDSGYVYLGAHPQSGRVTVLSRRKTVSGSNDFKAISGLIEKLKQSGIAGYGHLSADRRFGEQISFNKCKEILSAIFHKILPDYGFAVRDSQVELAEEMLAAINSRQIMLAEGETGTGKTWAYLIAAILIKRGRVNDYWNMGYYPLMHYVNMPHMPIVISTSSIALQKALVEDYIPLLSRILLAHGIIDTPITAVLRKGRGHYVCERKLRVCLKNEANPATAEALALLLKQMGRNVNIDLTEISWLNAYTKRRICVPNRCDNNCPHYSNCAYLDFRKDAQSNKIDIQVCNHQYLLADTIGRAENRHMETRPALIPNYQSIIIDEAHRFYQAAQSMYGVEFSNAMTAAIKAGIDRLKFRSESGGSAPRKLARKLNDENKRFFRELVRNGGQSAFSDFDKSADESERLTVDITNKAIRHLLNMLDISDALMIALEGAPVAATAKDFKAQILSDIGRFQDQADTLLDVEDYIYWLEVDGICKFVSGSLTGAIGDKLDYSREITLCTIPKNLNETLYENLFGKGIPIVLTSGTISANGDFSHIKRQLGLERLSPFRITETTKPSPFDYYNNALIYISETMSFPDNKDRDYIFSLANEIEELLYASHGHAAVLFTSYRAMDMVWEHLSDRGVPYPMFRLDRGAVNEIEKFKQSDGGVLFASGSLWEGIDIPGDILSLLIIPKLPFAAPDPINEYERSLCADIVDFKHRIIMPEMLIKLKQGFGRLIRTVSDTGCVAILDSRVNKRGSYRKWVLKTLPACYVTDDIGIVEGFMRVKKLPCYFKTE